MPENTLTRRDLNRATLARQLLLSRSEGPVLDTVEQLVGLQAQLPAAPFVGLWSRLEAFGRDELRELIEQRHVVRATMMRATLHLVTASDYWLLRPTLQSALAHQYGTVLGHRTKEIDLPSALEAAQSFFATPHTFSEFREVLERLGAGADIRALAYGVRTHVPLIQVPSPAAAWGYPGSTRFVTAQSWLGRPLPEETSLPELIVRYLAAFGPARAIDIQAWGGFPPLRDELEKLRSELVVFPGERGGELFDLPEAPRPAADVPAPPRFLPEFDNLLLAWKDRSRVIAEGHLRRIMATPVLMHPTFLLDGFVAGTWKLEGQGEAATLAIEPFAPVSTADRDALVSEGERLARFMDPAAQSVQVTVT